MSNSTNTNELMHYGVQGMKWGKRMARGHAGPGLYLTKKRRLDGDKRDLEALNKGERLSVGLTKKRQAAFDKRDRAALEKRIEKNEAKAAKRLAKDQAKWDKAYQKNYVKAYNKAADYANDVLIPQINKKYSKIIKTKDWPDDPNYGKYLKEYETKFNKVLQMKVSELIGERPN